MHRTIMLAENSLIVTTLAMSNRNMADPRAGSFDSLTSRISAVEANVAYSGDPLLTAGAVCNNCYHFNTDGNWFDPPYPDIGVAVPGYRVRHADLPKIIYTATVSESAGSSTAPEAHTMWRLFGSCYLPLRIPYKSQSDSPGMIPARVKARVGDILDIRL